MELITRAKFLKDKKKKEVSRIERLKVTELERVAKAISENKTTVPISNKIEVQKHIEKQLALAGWGMEIFTTENGKKKKETRTWIRLGDLK